MADEATNERVQATLEQLEKIKKMLNLDDPSKVPSTKEILQMLQGSEFSEEMKKNIKNMLTGNTPQVFGNYSTLLAVLFVILVFSIILFFGYKLYKSIKEKELRKEEKKKLKQMKKKK